MDFTITNPIDIYHPISSGYTEIEDETSAYGRNEENLSAQISPSESKSVSSDGKIEDVVIEVDKKPGESGLTIYDTKTKEGIDYIEDPSKVLPVSTYE